MTYYVIFFGIICIFIVNTIHLTNNRLKNVYHICIFHLHNFEHVRNIQRFDVCVQTVNYNVDALEMKPILVVLTVNCLFGREVKKKKTISYHLYSKCMI